MVGAGISGCACAAALASAGVRVTVLSRALDSVGQPQYGPVVTADGWDRIAGVIAAMPPTLRNAWLDSSVASDTGAPFFCVDRRMLSIETKRALEGIPGLEFRQGLATGLRTEREARRLSGGAAGCCSKDDDARSAWSGRGRLVVETAFGEEIEADAVVLAVGLSLGGRVEIGNHALPGDRGGDMLADGLRASLEGLGVSFREVTVQVGSRFSRAEREQIERAEGLRTDRGEMERERSVWAAGVIPLRTALCAGQSGDAGPESRHVRSEERVLAWPSDYPPAPHWTVGLAADTIVVCETEEGQVFPVACPDGVATGEFYLSSEVAESAGVVADARRGPEAGTSALASRLGCSFAGLVVANTSLTGRLTVETDPAAAVWVAGRAGGAADYLESVASGVERAGDVVAALSSTAFGNGPDMRRQAP